MSDSDPVKEIRKMARRLRAQMEALIEKLDSLEPRPTSGWKRMPVRPAWRAANQIYEWGLKHHPGGRATYRSIYEAARSSEKWKSAMLPKSVATFAQYVRAYRRAKRMTSHRQAHRDGTA